MSAFTFVLKLDEHISGDIEAVTVRTYGVKNFDIKELKGKPLPIEVISFAYYHFLVFIKQGYNFNILL